MPPGSPVNAVYSGTFERSLDAKKRVTVPAKWLDGGEQDFQVIRNPQPDSPCLIVMPPEEFAQMEGRIQGSDLPAPRKRKAIRQFYSSAHAVTSDKQGRILLPEEVCSQAGLTSEVVLVGSKSRFEVWSKQHWQAAVSEDQEAYLEAAELIGL